MKKYFKEIQFVSKKSEASQFEMVNFEELIKMKPTSHNQFEFHKVSFYGLLLFTDKEGVYNQNFNEFSFSKGSLFTLCKDGVHKFYKSDAKGILLVFTENFIVNYSNKQEVSKTLLLFNEMLSSPKIQLDQHQLAEILQLIDLIKDEYNKEKDEYTETIFRNYIQIIITKLFRIKSVHNTNFQNNKYLPIFLVFQKLVEQACFKQKKVSFYADEMGITTKTLNNVTQQIIHKSAKAFIDDIRIVQCKRIIINSQYALTEIAYQVGFEDSTNFFKYFRKHTNLSPSQFRALHQQKS